MDLAIVSARIFTADPEWAWASALAVKDGRIAAVGSDDYIKSLITDDTRVLELPGRLVTPGLTDAHTHFLSFGRSLKMVDLRNMDSWETGRQRVAEAVAKAKPGQWLQGRGWNHFQWADATEPTRAELDDISPDNPVLLIRVCGHIAVANSKALEAAGITADTPDPDGGRIERDENGEPTGLLRNAYDAVRDVIPPPDTQELKEAALAAQQVALAAGLTGVHSIETLAEWDVWSELEAAGSLKMRIHHLLPPEQLDEAVARGVKPGAGSDHLWFGMIKLFADGSLGGGTALMHQPYLDQPDNTGLTYTPVEEMAGHIAHAYEQGCDVAIHAIGDKASTNALDAYARAREEHPGEHRDRVEHVQLCRSEDMERYYRMGVIASVQPVFIFTDWATAEKKWGLDRCTCSYAWKSLLDQGVRLQFGSDSPVEPIAPIMGLTGAVGRTCGSDPANGWFPEQKLGLEDALTAFTAMPAFTSRKDDSLGSLTPGKLADITVFNRDLEAVTVEDWPEVEIEMTIIDGEVVHRS